MGCIYLADDLRLDGRLCALKEVEHDRTLSAHLLKQARDQFLREATVLSAVGSPQPAQSIRFFLDRGARLSRHGFYRRQRSADDHERRAPTWGILTRS